jgi:hypothetical protein
MFQSTQEQNALYQGPVIPTFPDSYLYRTRVDKLDIILLSNERAACHEMEVKIS